MALDFDPEVVAVAAQPMWLHWGPASGPGGRCRHAPDYFARRADGTGTLVDVRPDDLIRDRDARPRVRGDRAGMRRGRLGVPPSGWVSLARSRRPTCGGWPATGTRAASSRA